MERNYYDDDFESFLKERSDQYTLYPSNRVWNNVYDFLHLKRKWHTITGTFLLLTMLVFIGLEIESSRNIQKGQKETPTQIAASSNYSTVAINNATPSIETKNSFTLLKSVPTAIPASSMGLKKLIEPNSSYQVRALDKLPTYLTMDYNSGEGQELLPEKVPKKANGINWLQDIAINRLSLKKDDRFRLQFYFSPTASYRKLKNNKDAINPKTMDISPLSGTPIDVDGIVNHEPAVGLEIGSSLMFNITKRLALKAGAQLNYVRYTINAYKSYPEKAQITLSSVVNSSHTETITSYSSIRNVGTRNPDHFQNRYVELSLPIGADYKVLGNKKWQLNVGGTVQPSYILYNDTYVLSGNYNNYTKDPGLVRKWNINAAVESSISYNAGDLRFQAGPQFRYQLLSTYTDRYGIRENLMEYGIKIGVIKGIK